MELGKPFTICESSKAVVKPNDVERVRDVGESKCFVVIAMIVSFDTIRKDADFQQVFNT